MNITQCSGSKGAIRGRAVRIATVGVAACLTIGLLGCGRGSKVSYPLSGGARWNYKVSSPGKLPGNIAKVTLTNLTPKDIQGTPATPVELTLFEPNGREGRKVSFFLSENESGLFGFAAFPQTPSAQYYLIRRPIAVGENWITTAPFSWPRMSATSIVESVNESVTVPGGVFDSCLKIKALAKPAKAEYGNQLSIEAHMWFAAGVGLVKATYQTTEGGRRGDEVTIQLEGRE